MQLIADFVLAQSIQEPMCLGVRADLECICRKASEHAAADEMRAVDKVGGHE